MKQKDKLKFNSIFGILERFILFFVLFSSSVLMAQTAPDINYVTPQTYKLGIPITNLSPSNTGGVVLNALSGVTDFIPPNTSGLAYLRQGVFDSAGNFFAPNTQNHTIMKITPAGVASIFAGTSGVSGNVNGSGTAAKFNYPIAITIDGDNTLFVCDYSNRLIRKITADGLVSTLAGNPDLPGPINGTGSNAAFYGPQYMVIDSYDNLFVMDVGFIRKVTPEGVVSTLAGQQLQGSTDGFGTAVSFGHIGGMTIDGDNTIYIADSGNHKIRKMTTPSFEVSTIAGSGTSGYINATGIAASFSTPGGIVIDPAGNLFVADNGNLVFRKITPSGDVSTYAFAGTRGYVSANLGNSTFGGIVYSMTFDATKNNIYFMEIGKNLRKLSRFGYSVSPDLPVGLSLDGSGTITGTPTAVTPTANYTITATNATGSSSKVVSITVALATPTITAQAAVLLSSTSVSVSSAITDLGATSPIEHGFVWSTAANPTIALSTKTTLGAKSAIGSFSSTITGLTPNTTYHVRGYATNSIGTDYSADMVFSTNFVPLITPLFNGLNFIFNFAQQSLVSTGNLTIRLFGSIFKPNAAYQIRLFSDPVTLATGTIDANGTLDKIITLPADTPIGLHHIVLTTFLADNTSFRKEIYLTVGADGSVTTAYNAIMLDIAENTTAVASILGSDSDTPTQALTYSISGGADAAKFSINSTTGALAFIAAPDFEYPANTETDNAYVVDVAVTDNGALNKSITNTLYLNVVNVAEIPLLANLQSLPAATGAALSVVIANDGGGGSVSEIGFVYSLTSANSNPIIGGTGVIKVTGTVGEYTTIATGLIASSAYTFKAYAINATGTGYTGTASFTTLGMNSAPSISYATPQNYELAKAITTLIPASIGSVIPALTYQQVSTFAGSGAAGSATATGIAATFNKPMGVALDNSGNLIVADAISNKIRKIADNGDVTTVAGSGTAGYNLSSASITNPLLANFSAPSAVAVDGTGNIFVTDQGNSQIRKIGTDGKVTVFAGKDWIYSFPFWYAQPGFVDNVSGTAAAFNKPEGLAIDSNGNLYVADTYNHRIRKITAAGFVTTIAGDGNADLFGGGRFLDGPGTAASFNYPTGVALDPTESYLYVADKVNQRIRKIALTAPYKVTTLAGSGITSSLDGIATAATFNNPEHLVVDGAGNVFVTEQAGNKIRKITDTGIVSTIAGSGTAGTTDGTGTAASFSDLTGIALSKAGIAYATDSKANKVRKISLGGYTISPALPTGLSFDITKGSISGTPTTIAGPTDYTVTGYNYYGTSSATVAIKTISLPTVSTTGAFPLSATTASAGGNVASDGGTLLTAKGICWSTTPNPTIADTKSSEGIATGSFTSALAGLSATTTYYVRAYATNVLGTAYGNQVNFTTFIIAPNIRYSTPNNFTINTLITPLSPTNTGSAIPNSLYGPVTTLAGSGLDGFTDATGTEASFSNPNGIAVDVSGNLYVSNQNSIRKITAAGVVTTFAGSFASGSFDSTGTAATFRQASGLAIDASGNMYVADTGNFIIRKITDAGVVTSLTASSGNLNTENFFNATGTAVDASGNVYVVDTNKHKISKVTAAGVVTTFAGSGLLGSNDDTGTAASFNYPEGIAIDASGNLYIGDTMNHKIRKITSAGVVTTLAGKGVVGAIDGAGTAASFNKPTGVAVDASGNVYVADKWNYKIRKITPTGAVTTIAGTGFNGTNDGTSTAAGFNEPKGVAVDAFGNIYVADTRNNKIRKISNIGYLINPALPLGLTMDGTGTITGTPTVLSPATNYIVTAYNAGGSSSYTVNFAVTAALDVTQETFSKAVVAYPNPYSDFFKIDAKTNSSDAITIAVYDMLGRKIENHKVIPTEVGTLQCGKNYPSGVYNVILTQGTEVKRLRVIKK